MSAYQEEGLAPGEHRFATKVDNWLLAVLVTAGIVSVGSILLSASTDPNAAIVSLVMVVLAFAVVIALAFPTHYTIGASELIIRSGFNVYPPDVEAVLTQHPDVTLSAVVGRVVPGNEEVVAYVQLVPGSSTSADDIRAFAAERLAAYKRPARVIIMDLLPATPSGKILKGLLRQRVNAE